MKEFEIRHISTYSITARDEDDAQEKIRMGYADLVDEEFEVMSEEECASTFDVSVTITVTAKGEENAENQLRVCLRGLVGLTGSDEFEVTDWSINDVEEQDD